MAERQTKPKSKRSAPKSGATTRKTPSKPRAGLPGWLWGLAGLVAGFFLAQYVQESAPPMPATVLSKPDAANQDREQAKGEDDADSAMPTFEFYTLLPESEVVAPQQSKVTAPKPPPQAPANDDKPQEAATIDPIAAQLARQEAAKANRAASATKADGYRYMLQAASFRSTDDAARMASRLKDFGLLARITQVKGGDGNTWHRVQVGPYTDTAELNRAQDLMVAQGIEPLMIRLQR